MHDRELRDRVEIREVLERYCRGIDRCDEELLRSVYHLDATDDHGTFKGNGLEFAGWVVEQLQAFDATMHTLGQSLIELDGDRAKAETYVVAYHHVTRGERRFLDQFGGRYVDRLERRNEEWKISDRVVVFEWSKVDEIERTMPSQMLDTFERGKRSRDDLVYRK